MPSLTWTPGRGEPRTLLGLLAEGRHQPMIQFYSTYGTLWSAEPFAERRLPAGRGLRRRAGLQLVRRPALGGDAVRQHRFDEIWASPARCAIREHGDYAQAMVGLRQLRDRPLQPRRHHRPRGARSADNDSRSLGRRPPRQRRLRPRRQPPRRDVRRRLHRRRHNYDYGTASQAGPIDPFDPVYTGVGSVGPIIDNPPVDIQSSSRSTSRTRSSSASVPRRSRAALRLDRADPSTGTGATPCRTRSPRPASACSTTSATGSRPMSAIRNPSPGGHRHRPERQSLRADPRQPVRGRRQVPAAGHRRPLHRRGLRPHQVEHAGRRPASTPTSGARPARRSSRARARRAGDGWPQLRPRLYLPRHRGSSRQPLEGVPENQASAWLQYAFDGALAGLEAGLRRPLCRRRRSDERGLRPRVTTPSYTLYDAMVGYQWDRYQVDAGRPEPRGQDLW